MDPRSATRNLILATFAFAVAFVGWSLIAPLGKRFQDDLDLSNTRTLMLTAVPVSPRRLAEFRPVAYLPKPFPLEALLRLAERSARTVRDDDRPED